MPPSNVWDEGRWKGVTEVTLDFTARYIFEHMAARVDPAGKTILELGAGTGRLSYLFLGKGAQHVTLVDSSEKAAALARQLFAPIAPDRYEIIPSDLFEFTPKEPFDLVFSSGLIEHFQGPDRRRVIEAHLAHCRRDCLLLHPSHRLYNRLLDRTPMARRRYGFAQTYPESELDAYLAGLPRVMSVHHQRFHPFYAVPFLHNRERINRSCARIPFGRTCGGLCLTHITLSNP